MALCVKESSSLHVPTLRHTPSHACTYDHDTARMWRHPIRDVEKYQEVEKINAYNGHDGAAAARLSF